MYRFLMMSISTLNRNSFSGGDKVRDWVRSTTHQFQVRGVLTQQSNPVHYTFKELSFMY